MENSRGEAAAAASYSSNGDLELEVTSRKQPVKSPSKVTFTEDEQQEQQNNSEIQKNILETVRATYPATNCVAFLHPKLHFILNPRQLWIYVSHQTWPPPNFKRGTSLV
jgi:hypothetical protein